MSEVIDRVMSAAAEHDAAVADRLLRWRVLEPEAGQFLSFLVQAIVATNIVEIGTSRGVSTLWLADAARRIGGLVTSVDTDATAQQEAHENLVAAGVDKHARFVTADGGELLRRLPDGGVDLLFLDAERCEYPSWWPDPVRVLRPGGILVADNATSHPGEIASLRQLLEDPATGLDTTTLNVGKGELLAINR